MAYPAKVIANYFIKKAKEQNDSRLNLMKLLKEIYMAHGYHLAFRNTPLILENIEAWQYGPVIKNIYHSLKHNGLQPIHSVIEERDINEFGEFFINKYDSPIDPDTKNLLDKVIDAYRNNTGIQLSNWSHDPNGPWHKVWESKQGSSKEIPNSLIKDYFFKQGSQHDGTRA